VDHPCDDARDAYRNGNGGGRDPGADGERAEAEQEIG
jgi:hypothetical protein